MRIFSRNILKTCCNPHSYIWITVPLSEKTPSNKYANIFLRQKKWWICLAKKKFAAGLEHILGQSKERTQNWAASTVDTATLANSWSQNINFFFTSIGLEFLNGNKQGREPLMSKQKYHIDPCSLKMPASYLGS